MPLERQTITSFSPLLLLLFWPGRKQQRESSKKNYCYVRASTLLIIIVENTYCVFLIYLLEIRSAKNRTLFAVSNYICGSALILMAIRLHTGCDAYGYNEEIEIEEVDELVNDGWTIFESVTL